ncbi:hypothetical protein MPG74_02560 [Helicobacter pylori]|nr:hypothetical protein [Helicobacter pylori]UOS06592.1 hypothetical protein MPG74_00640 [Helicobacter pylori]UOS06610.1 hypothetical protein MPG74_02560 [Helicobacter pylori]
MFLSKRGRNGIQSFNHSIIQSFNHLIIQSFNHLIKQRYPVVITFTKTHSKIPYSLLFLFSLTHTAIFLKNLIR